MKASHRHLLECISGNASPEAQAWAVAVLVRCWHEGEALGFYRCAGLVTRQKATDAIRNDLLRQAAQHIDGCVTHKAEELAVMNKDMETRLWKLWRDEAYPPERAGPVLTLLFKAKQMGATLPCGVRTVFDIITDAETGQKSRRKSPIA